MLSTKKSEQKTRGRSCERKSGNESTKAQVTFPFISKMDRTKGGNKSIIVS